MLLVRLARIPAMLLRFALPFGVLTALVLAAAAHAQGPAPADPPASRYGAMLLGTPEGVGLLEEGRAQMLAFRLDEAEATFRRLDAAEPGSPAAAYHRVILALWRALMAEREPYYGRFFARADSLDARLDALPDSPWKTHFRAEIAFARAALLAKQERFPRAALALRSAYNGFEANVRRYPDFVESYKGMGLCHVAVGAVPRSYRWILSVLGFGGSVPQGMAELARAATESRYNREEAALYLAAVDAVLNERKAGAIEGVRRLYEGYRGSPMTAYLYAYLLLDARRADEAEALLREAEAAQQAPGVEDIPYVQYYLGEALFRQNRFDEAVGFFEGYARTYRGEALLAQAYLHAGLCREMLGAREAAEVHYRRVRSDRDLDSDQAALRDAERLLRRPMTETERTLLRGQNLYDGGRYREAVATLQPLFGEAGLPEVQRAEAAYRTARAYHALGEGDEALRHYRLAVERPGDPLAKWGPWSQFYIGEVYEARGDGEAARQAYRAALAYEQPFDYHKGLEQRARTALARLR